MGIYQVKGLKSPVVVLNESPKVNMIRLIDELQPSLIVADGSNYQSSCYVGEDMPRNNHSILGYTSTRSVYFELTEYKDI